MNSTSFRMLRPQVNGQTCHLMSAIHQSKIEYRLVRTRPSDLQHDEGLISQVFAYSVGKMSIEIYCPNGHKLICPEDFTGSNVKCPRCGRLAEVSARNVSRSSIMSNPSPQSVDDPSDSRVPLEHDPDPHEAATVKQKQSPLTANQISFLCPNGHKLNAAANLQGRVGQCPHCNEKFRIPVIAAESAKDSPGPSTTETYPPPESPPPTREPVEGPGSESVFSDESMVTEASTSQISEIAPNEIREIAPSPGGTPVGGPHGETPHVSAATTASLLSIFETLWEERAHGAVVELHLAEGVIVTPDWWARGLSDTGFGVFALENRDGSYQMEAIAWDSVQRVVVRNISELPGGLFG